MALHDLEVSVVTAMLAAGSMPGDARARTRTVTTSTPATTRRCSVAGSG